MNFKWNFIDYLKSRSFLVCLTYFVKIKVGLRGHFAVCVSIPLMLANMFNRKRIQATVAVLLDVLFVSKASLWLSEYPPTVAKQWLLKTFPPH
jgi:hypothetical protein